MFTIVVGDMKLVDLSILAVITSIYDPPRFIQLMYNNVYSMISCKSHNAVISPVSAKLR